MGKKFNQYLLISVAGVQAMFLSNNEIIVKFLNSSFFDVILSYSHI